MTKFSLIFGKNDLQKKINVQTTGHESNLALIVLFTSHLNCKYHPWGLINNMEMSIYNRKHWHALSHLLHFV